MQIDGIEGRAYDAGVAVGERLERDRIIALLDGVKLSSWQTDWEWFWNNPQNEGRDEAKVYDLMQTLIRLIEGEE